MSEDSNEVKKVVATYTQDMLDADPTLVEKGIKVGDNYERDETPEEADARVAKERADAEAKVAADEAAAAEAKAAADAAEHQADEARKAADLEAEQNAGAASNGTGIAPGERHPLA